LTAKPTQPAKGELPKQLALAEEYATGLGKQVERLEVTAGDEKRPALKVFHGSFFVLVLTLGDGLVLLLDLTIPAKDRERLKAYTPQTQEDLLITLRSDLLRRPRTGHSFAPQNPRVISDLEAVRVEQQLVLSRNEVGTQNRLQDAIQELVQAGAAASQILTLGDPKAADTYTTSKDHVPGYA
jgi:hypothetical protein